MFSLKKCAFLLLLCLSSPALLKADLAKNKEYMIAELEEIKQTFDHQYAPKAWKKEFLGWDLNLEIEKAKTKVLQASKLSTKDFHKIVRDFFRTTKDHHVNVLFYSDESAFIPFDIKSAEGRYFIAYVYESMLPMSKQIDAGDEILEINDRPIQDLIAEFQLEEFGSTGPGADHELAQMFFTHRVGMLGQKVPRGPVTLKVAKALTKEKKTVQLIWSYKPETIINESKNGFRQLGSFFPIKAVKKPRIQGFIHPWQTPYFHEKAKLETKMIRFAKTKLIGSMDKDEEEEEEESPYNLGSTEGFLPELGKIWWENKGFYRAYIFETDDHRLMGYLRIPHYSDFSFMGLSLSELIFIPELKKILSMFEERTEGLVIDQLNNPGGSVFFLYAIASLLSDEPLKTPKHRMTLNHQNIVHANIIIPVLEKVTDEEQAVESIENLFGSEFNCNGVGYEMAQFILEFCRFIKDEWAAGKKITDPFYIYGVDHINPNPDVNYTKPILFLTNELDFSGGDFLPAILQDNKRVKILGAQTAGAGGYVLGKEMSSRFGIAGFSYTGSIAERVSGLPIENLGVTPDIPYEMTVEDLQNDYESFKQVILENL